MHKLDQIVNLTFSMKIAPTESDHHHHHEEDAVTVSGAAGSQSTAGVTGESSVPATAPGASTQKSSTASE